MITRINQEVTSGLEKSDQLFDQRFQQQLGELSNLYQQVYACHPAGQQGFEQLLQIIRTAYQQRPAIMKQRDLDKQQVGKDPWFLSNEITGMSLYVDRFCGNLQGLKSKLDYFEKLGVNFLHLMPVFESPAGESDGGYAVSDFRKVDQRFGSLADLKELQADMQPV